MGKAAKKGDAGQRKKEPVSRKKGPISRKKEPVKAKRWKVVDVLLPLFAPLGSTKKQMLDASVRETRTWRLLASLSSLIPTGFMIGMGIALHVSWFNIYVLACVSFASTGVAFCIGACQHVAARIQWIGALQRDRSRQGKSEEAIVLELVLHNELLRRRKFYFWTTLTLGSWLMVAVNYLMSLRNASELSPVLMGFLALVNCVFAIRKILDSQRIPPQLESLMGVVDPQVISTRVSVPIDDGIGPQGQGQSKH